MVASFQFAWHMTIVSSASQSQSLSAKQFPLCTPSACRPTAHPCVRSPSQNWLNIIVPLEPWVDLTHSFQYASDPRVKIVLRLVMAKFNSGDNPTEHIPVFLNLLFCCSVLWLYYTINLQAAVNLVGAWADWRQWEWQTVLQLTIEPADQSIWG